MPSDDAAPEPLDVDGWDAEAAADAVPESEDPFWPQALTASAAIAAVAAAVAVTEVFMHCPCVVVRRLREEVTIEFDWPAAVGPP